MQRFLGVVLIIGVVFSSVAAVGLSAAAAPGVGGGFFFDASCFSFTGVVRSSLGDKVAGGHFDILFPSTSFFCTLPLTFIPYVVANAPFPLSPGILLIPYIGVGPVIRIPPPSPYPQPLLVAKIGDMLTFFGFGIYAEVAFRVLSTPLAFQGIGFGVTVNF